MIILIIAMDSWHLNGVHCPNVRVSLPGETLAEAFSELTRIESWAKALKNAKGEALSVAMFQSDLEQYGYARTVVYDGGIEGVAIAYQV